MATLRTATRRSHGVLNGTVHVYCTVTAAQSIVPDLFGRVRRAHPGIRIELATGYASDAIDRLRGGDIDISVAALPDRLPAGIASPATRDHAVVFVGPNVDGPIREAINRRRIEWPTMPLVLPAHGLARDYVNEWLDTKAITPTIYAEIEGHEAILALVALGCGVGVVPKLVLENSALQDRITEIPTRPALPAFRVASVSANAHSPTHSLPQSGTRSYRSRTGTSAAPPWGGLRADRRQGHAARVHALEQADSGAEQHG